MAPGGKAVQTRKQRKAQTLAQLDIEKSIDQPLSLKTPSAAINRKKLTN
jgi:hypothetical protein